MEYCNFDNIFISRVNSLKGDISVRSFATTIGVAQQSVDKYLKGETTPPISFLVKIAVRFGVSTDWLLGLTNEKGGEYKPRIPERIQSLKNLSDDATKVLGQLQSALDALDKQI